MIGFADADRKSKSAELESVSQSLKDFRTNETLNDFGDLSQRLLSIGGIWSSWASGVSRIYPSVDISFDCLVAIILPAQIRTDIRLIRESIISAQNAATQWVWIKVLRHFF